jgi:hypothetical protein
MYPHMHTWEALGQPHSRPPNTLRAYTAIHTPQLFPSRELHAIDDEEDVSKDGVSLGKQVE